MNFAYQFENEFFDYMDPGSRRSAISVVSVVAERLKPRSVLDVGCGRGVWLSEWKRADVGDCMGVDGPYVDRATLAIPPECFMACDLSRPLNSTVNSISSNRLRWRSVSTVLAPTYLLTISVATAN